MEKLHFTPLIYLSIGDTTPNVQFLVDNPFNVSHLWQSEPSVYLIREK
jgi:hypothetical protein